MESAFHHVAEDLNLPCTTDQLRKLLGAGACAEAQLGSNGIVIRYIAGATLFCAPGDGLLAGYTPDEW